MRLFIAVVLVACHAPPAPVAPHDRVPAPPSFDVEHVERYERGDGVPRDFRTAARLYAEACRAGCGDLTACHGLLELAIANRGIIPTLDDVHTAARMCKRGDDTACLAVGMIGFDKGVAAPTRLECTPTDRDACEAAMWMDVNLHFAIDGPPDPPTADELRHAMTGPAAQLCAMGVADGCMHVLGSCRDRACVDRRGAALHAAGVDAAPLAAAWQAVDRACTAGDVDACERAGRPLAAAELCRAGDEDACGHSHIATIDALHAQVVALLARCRAGDRAACDRIAHLTATACP